VTTGVGWVGLDLLKQSPSLRPVFASTYCNGDRPRHMDDVSANAGGPVKSRIVKRSLQIVRSES